MTTVIDPRRGIGFHEGRRHNKQPSPVSKAGPVMEFKQILIPIDFSACSKRAIDAGIAMARQFGAQVHLLHIVEPAAAAPLALAGVLPQGEMVERLEENARELIRKLVDEYGKDVKVDGLVAAGSPPLEIARFAKRNNIDLIVTATHGRTGIGHVLMGSVAERLVRHAPCPVMVVPSKESSED